MQTVLHKLVDRATENVALISGRAKRHFASQKNMAHVLTYHGLISDELADRPWVPSHFVTVSQFERQMAMLAQLGPARTLSEAMGQIQRESALQGPTVAITFDDGTADNVILALPILNKYRHRATFFLATGHVDRNELLPNDVIRILRVAYMEDQLKGHLSPLYRKLLVEPGYNKSCSLFSYRSGLYDLWTQNQDMVDPVAIRSLQMMSWDEARTLYGAGMEIGAHTVNHAILACEDQATRRREIADSVAHIQNELGQQEVPFSYPNGEIGNYDGTDLEVLASLEAPYAVAESTGWNDSTTPPLELRRNCIGLHCSDRAFLAQVFGLRDSKRQQQARKST